MAQDVYKGQVCIRVPIHTGLANNHESTISSFPFYQKLIINHWPAIRSGKVLLQRTCHCWADSSWSIPKKYNIVYLQFIFHKVSHFHPHYIMSLAIKSIFCLLQWHQWKFQKFCSQCKRCSGLISLTQGVFLAPVLTVARFVEHKLSEGSNGGPWGALTTTHDQLPFLENGHRRRSRDLPRAH